MAEKMTTGGGWKDVGNAWRHAAKRCQGFALKLWVAFHNDQRLSWIGHYIVCAAGSNVMATVFELLGWSGELGFVVGAVQGCIYFVGIREPGDEAKWRAKRMWDVLDDDTNIKGKSRRGITRRFDKVADCLGPAFNLATALQQWAW